MKVNGFSNFNLAGVQKRTTAGDQSTANREKSGKQEDAAVLTLSAGKSKQENKPESLLEKLMEQKRTIEEQLQQLNEPEKLAMTTKEIAAKRKGLNFMLKEVNVAIQEEIKIRQVKAAADSDSDTEEAGGLQMEGVKKGEEDREQASGDGKALKGSISIAPMDGAMSGAPLAFRNMGSAKFAKMVDAYRKTSRQQERQTRIAQAETEADVRNHKLSQEKLEQYYKENGHHLYSRTPHAGIASVIIEDLPMMPVIMNQ